MTIKGAPGFQLASLPVKIIYLALKVHDSIRVSAKQIIK